MSDRTIKLEGASTMALDKVTASDGSWYLRQWYDDERAVRLVSEHAPAGTLAADLRAGHVEVESDVEGETVCLPIDTLQAFATWPPNS